MGRVIMAAAAASCMQVGLVSELSDGSPQTVDSLEGIPLWLGGEDDNGQGRAGRAEQGCWWWCWDRISLIRNEVRCVSGRPPPTRLIEHVSKPGHGPWQRISGARPWVDGAGCSSSVKANPASSPPLATQPSRHRASVQKISGCQTTARRAYQGAPWRVGYPALHVSSGPEVRPKLPPFCSESSQPQPSPQNPQLLPQSVGCVPDMCLVGIGCHPAAWSRMAAWG